MLQGLVWVQIEPSTVEVDGLHRVLGVAEAAGQASDLQDLAIESPTRRVDHRVVVVSHDIVDVPANRLAGLAHRPQLAMRDSEVPPLRDADAGLQTAETVSQGKQHLSAEGHAESLFFLRQECRCGNLWPHRRTMDEVTLALLGYRFSFFP